MRQARRIDRPRSPLGQRHTVLIPFPAERKHLQRRTQSFEQCRVMPAGNQPSPNRRETMSKLVLVVDDSAAVRQQGGMALRQAGFEVVEASDGMEGVSAVARNPKIAMVISDVNMPNMNGLDMVAELKKNPSHRALPIIMLTTEDQPALLKQAKEAGAMGWLVKPFNAGQLVATVKKLTA